MDQPKSGIKLFTHILAKKEISLCPKMSDSCSFQCLVHAAEVETF